MPLTAEPDKQGRKWKRPFGGRKLRGWQPWHSWEEAPRLASSGPSGETRARVPQSNVGSTAGVGWGGQDCPLAKFKAAPPSFLLSRKRADESGELQKCGLILRKSHRTQPGQRRVLLQPVRGLLPPFFSSPMRRAAWKGGGGESARGKEKKSPTLARGCRSSGGRLGPSWRAPPKELPLPPQGRCLQQARKLRRGSEGLRGSHPHRPQVQQSLRPDGVRGSSAVLGPGGGGENLGLQRKKKGTCPSRETPPSFRGRGEPLLSCWPCVGEWWLVAPRAKEQRRPRMNRAQSVSASLEGASSGSVPLSSGTAQVERSCRGGSLGVCVGVFPCHPGHSCPKGAAS